MNHDTASQQCEDRQEFRQSRPEVRASPSPHTVLYGGVSQRHRILRKAECAPPPKSVPANGSISWRPTCSGQLTVTRKPSRIAASELAFSRLDRETFLTHLEAVIGIEGGGVRKLQIVLPESAGADLRFEPVQCPFRIVEQTAGEPAEGRRVWTLQIDQRARGRLRLLVDVQQPREKLKEFAVPLLQIPAAERVDGYIALEAAADQRLEIQADDGSGKSLPEIDPADLPMPAGYYPRERIVGAYTYVGATHRVTLRETRYERVAVPTAVCRLLDLTSVLGDTGEFQHQATYSFRAVGVQGLEVTLPAGGDSPARLWATLIDGQPIEVRKSGEAYLIPLVSTGDPTAERSLQLFYNTEVDTLGTAGRLQQAPPALAAVNGQGVKQPFEILDQKWLVYTPQNVAFVDSQDEFQPRHPLSAGGWLGALQRAFSRDDSSAFRWKLVWILLVAAVLSGIWLVRRLNWVGVAIGSFVILVLFVALITPSVQQAREAARHPQQESYLAWMIRSPSFSFFGVPEADVDFSGGTSESYDTIGMYGYAKKSAPASPPVPMADSPFEELAPAAEEAAPMSQQMPSPEVAAGSISVEGLEISEEEAAAKDGDAGRVIEGYGGAAAKPGDPLGRVGQPAFGNGRVFTTEPDIAMKDGGFPQVPGTPAPAQAAPAPAGQPVVQPPAAVRAKPGPMVDGPGPGQMPMQAPQNGAVTVHGVGLVVGLLSLAVDLEPPPASRATQFVYHGSASGAQGPKLDLKYQNRARLTFTTPCVGLLMVLVLWWSRRSASLRLGLAVVGVGLPLTLMSLAAPGWLPLLDGLFFGTLAGLGLWLVIAVIEHGCRPLTWNQNNG